MATDQGMAVVRFSGVMDEAGTLAAIAAFADHVGGTRAAAGVLDYQAADSAIPLAMLAHQVRRTAARAQALATPTALVVRCDELAAWQAHARRLSGAGLLRAAFDDAHRARSWAAEMAALYAAQARFRGRG